MKKILIPIIIILAIVIIIFVAKDKPVDPLVPDADTADVIEAGASGQFAKLASNALVVRDQKPDDVVFVSALNMESGGFVIIHTDEDGRAGNIVGVSKWFAPGNYADEEVGVIRKLSDNTVYHAQLHADDGDGIFDPKSDKTVVGQGGDELMSTFSVSVKAEDPRDTVIYY